MVAASREIGVTGISRRQSSATCKAGDMRRWLCVLIVIAGCSSPSAPSSEVAGTWTENFSVVGASLILTVDSSGNGNGTYAIEAGRSGTVQVIGRASTSTVTFVLRYDFGIVRTFSGTLTDDNHLAGSFDDSSGEVVFTRRTSLRQ